MTKHVSDSERLVIATLHRRETELKQARELIDQLKKQLKVQNDYITELKSSNKLLASQVRFLIHKQISHD
ncbi:MAG: hypothetical protein J6S85_07475 [Methanobrevibacter sp.]|nr:hypothetical protein [Methanobrevibacter sp.]